MTRISPKDHDSQNPDYSLDITWEPGLCRCGCQTALTNPNARFVKGHDFILLDNLIDAYKHADSPVRLTIHDQTQILRPTEYAKQAFFPSGYRWYLIKTDQTQPTIQERARTVPDLDLPSLTDDLALLRDLVQRVTPDLSQDLTDALDRIAQLESQPPLLAPDTSIDQLSDQQVILTLTTRLRKSAQILADHKYRPLANEVYDLITIFNSKDKVRALAARALLGAP